MTAPSLALRSAEFAPLARWLALAAAAMTLAACGSGSDDGSPAGTVTPAPTPTPPAVTAPPPATTPAPTPSPVESRFDPSSELASYRITFSGSWTAESGFGTVPAPAHFSDIIGAPVTASSMIWRSGNVSSPGIEEVAEAGTTGAIRPEIEAAVAANDARAVVRIGDGRTEPGETVSGDISFSSVFSHFTFITMVAPSPDWFVGLSAFNLRNDSGEWIETVQVPLRIYDAGTEDGDSFSPENPATVPPQPIARLNAQVAGGLLIAEGLLNGQIPIATVSFERIE